MARFPKRPPRLTRVFQRYASPVYFVTFGTHDRKPWLATPAIHDAFVRFAENAEARFNIAIGCYVIMPDHVHLFVCGGQEFELGHWIGQLKQFLAKAAAKSSAGGTPWQEGFFDHLLRSEESMSEKWEYIRQNSVRAGLVEDPDDWPYQGQIVLIESRV